MEIKKGYLILLISIGLFDNGSAQDSYYVDALRYTNNGITGSARIQALGGASAALGADLGTIYTNPAGLGYYRKSEIGLTICPMASSSSATPNSHSFTGLKNSDFRLNFNVPNLGIAIFLGKSDYTESKWRGGTLAFSQTRIANFQNSITYTGVDSSSSLIIRAVNDLNDQGFNYSGFDKQNITSLGALAWYGYAIERKPVVDNFGNIVKDSSGGTLRYNNAYTGLWPDNLTALKKQETISTQGSMSEWNLSYGGNYDDRFYFGASVGIVGLRYVQSKKYQEFSTLSRDPGMQSLTYTDNLSVNGTGINLTIGLNYKFSDFLRMGASFKTPTNIWISETQSSSLQTTFNNFGYLYDADVKASNLPASGSASTLSRNFQYSMVTPFRANYGLAVFIKKYGFLTADIEYVNYASSFLSSDLGNAQFVNANNSISTQFAEALNLKGGIEIRLDFFRIRAGYSYFGSPYASNVESSVKRVRNGESSNITGGIGFKMNNYFFDVTFVNTTYQSTYSPYVLTNNTQPVVAVKNNFNNLMFSAGFNF